MTKLGPATCASCGTLIVFREHERTLNPAPIDAVPSADPKANVLILPEYRYRVLKAGDVIPPGEGRFFSHFFTCPFADRHRPRKQAEMPVRA